MLILTQFVLNFNTFKCSFLNDIINMSDHQTVQVCITFNDSSSIFRAIGNISYFKVIQVIVLQVIQVINVIKVIQGFLFIQVFKVIKVIQVIQVIKVIKVI